MPHDLQSVWNGRDPLTSRPDDLVVPRETSNDRWCPACRRWKPRNRFPKGYRNCRKCRSSSEAVRSKRNIDKAKDRGICQRCRKNPAQQRNTHCQRCLDHIRNNARARNARRLARNRCTRCGAPNNNPKSRWYCLDCSQDRLNLNQHAIAKAFDNGLCRTCRKNPVASRKGRPTKRCEHCLLKDAQGAKNRRKARKTATMNP